MRVAAHAPVASLWPEVVEALATKPPAIAAPISFEPPPSAPVAIADRFHLGQELTIVPEGYLRPIEVADEIAAITGGTSSELVKNGKARVESPYGLWIVEHDGKQPGGSPIIEVGTPPLTKANEAILEKAILALHARGGPLASVGGGHIHVDGAPFLASPRLLSRFLQVYLHIEPAILSAHRHAARSHAARGLSELLPEKTKALAQAFAALEDESAATLQSAIAALIEAHELNRNMALNVLSLAGVVGGNKKSKGTIELRLFDSPKDSDHARAQRKLVRGMLAAALSAGALPAPGSPPIGDLAQALEWLEAKSPTKLPPGPWTVALGSI
jgi:hypothetical protein